MSAAQPSRFFGRFRSAFGVTSSTAPEPSHTNSQLPEASSPSFTATPSLVSKTDPLQLLEEAIAAAEAHITREAAPSLAPIVEQPNLAVLAQAVPTVIEYQSDTLNSHAVSAAPKEQWIAPVVVSEQPTAQPVSQEITAAETSTTALGSESAVQTGLEAGPGVTYAELGPSTPEIPVEVEGYLQEVKDHQEQLPQEIVIAADQFSLQPPQPQPLRPVVVLPITPEMEAVGLRKNPSWSLRWLVTWSQKIMKVFAGKVIYHPQQPV